MPGANEAGAASAFVDTNIWVYAHLRAPGDVRHERALALVQGRANLVISPQVVAEYYGVMLRNAQADAWIQANLRAIFARSRLQPANAEMLSIALEMRNRHGFSFWDCQIVAAALLARCNTLLTEDLPHGQMVEGCLRVVDPLRQRTQWTQPLTCASTSTCRTGSRSGRPRLRRCGCGRRTPG